MARKGEKMLRIAAAWIVGRRLEHPPRKEKQS